MNLIEFVPVGNEKRITSSEISNKLGISGAEVRRQINALRCDGIPVASDSHGYYIATEQSDLNRTIASFNSRINQMMKARDGLKRAQIWDEFARSKS